MESEEYFKRIYEQSGAYNHLSYDKTHSTTYGEKSTVIGPTMDHPVNNPALSAAMIITHPNEHQQPRNQQLNNYQQVQYHEQQQLQFHKQHQQQHTPQLHEQQHYQRSQQQQGQQLLYKCNECGSRWANLKTFRQHQRKHFNSPEEVHPLPPLKYHNYVEEGPATSALQVSPSTNSDYIPNNFLSLMPEIPQSCDPETHKIYPPDPPKSCNLESPEMYKPQPSENCVKLKRMKFDLKNEKGKKSDKHTDIVMGVNTGNTFLNLEHSVFQNTENRVMITQDSYLSDDSDTDSRNHSYTKEEIEKNINYLEAKLEDNINLLKSFDRKDQPKNQQRNQCHKNVKSNTDSHDPEPDDNSIIGRLVAETTPMLDVIRWFQQHQLLKSEIKCSHCKHVMTWKTVFAMKKFRDGFYWKCLNRKCPSVCCRKNIRAGTIFERSKICLKKWLHIMYKWSNNAGTTAVSKQLTINSKTIGECYSFFREVCEQYFKENPVKLGGPGITIEINVFCLSDGRKRNKGTGIQLPICVLTIVDTQCIPSIGYMEIVESRDVATLLPIISKVVQPGSVIHSGEWREFRKIQGVSDTVRTVNHYVNFVDVDYTIPSQTIESYWNKHKSYIMAMKGIIKSALNSHLQEFMWRERFSENVLEILCEQISIQYSNETFNDNQDSSHVIEDVNELKNKLEEKLRAQSSRSITQDRKSLTQNKDSIKQEPSDSQPSFIDNPDDSVEESPPKKCRPVAKKKRQSHKQVKFYTDKQVPELECDSDIVPLFAETAPMLDVIKWFQQHQLLKSEMKCDHCDHVMSWKTVLEMKKFKDGFYWKCKNRSCPKYECRKNVRAGTVFERSKMCLKTWLHIMYKWSKNVGSTAASEQININSKTMGQCYSFFREICEAYFKANPIKLGGPGIAIEIDVSFITKWSHKPKGNRGPEQQHPILALGIVDTTCTPAIGYMEIVETEDVLTLFPMILKVVRPGSIIYSNNWQSYRKIQGLLCLDGTVNHSVNFVDVDTNVHKTAIESYWEKHKSYIAAMRSCTKNTVSSYLQEFMWRERFSENALEILCEQIALQYSDASYIDKTDCSHLGKETEIKKLFKG